MGYPYVVTAYYNGATATGTSGATKGSGSSGAFSGPIWMSDVRCRGDESRLDDCQFRGWGSAAGCGHEQDVWLRCSVVPPEGARGG